MKKALIRSFLILFILGTVFWVLLIVSTTIFPSDNPIKPIILQLLNLPADFIGKPYIGGGSPFDDFMYGNWFYNFTSFSTLIVVTGLFTLTRGRNILEKLLLLQAYALPRERDYWGKITDRKTHSPVPFSTVRIYSISKNGEKFLQQAIADLDGRYRFYLPENDLNLILEIRSPGYKIHREKITTSAIEGMNVVKTNVVLEKEDDDTSISPFRLILVKNRSRVLNFLISYILFLSFVTFTHAIYSLVFHFNFISVGDFIFYGFAFPWNAYVIFQRRRFNPGRLIDSYTMKPVPNVSIQVFLPAKKMLSILSDENGVVKFDIDPGSYDAKVFKPGYLLKGTTEIVEIDVNNEGYLRDNISLLPVSTKTVSGSALANPFGK